MKWIQHKVCVNAERRSVKWRKGGTSSSNRKKLFTTNTLTFSLLFFDCFMKKAFKPGGDYDTWGPRTRVLHLFKRKSLSPRAPFFDLYIATNVWISTLQIRGMRNYKESLSTNSKVCSKKQERKIQNETTVLKLSVVESLKMYYNPRVQTYMMFTEMKKKLKNHSNSETNAEETSTNPRHPDTSNRGLLPGLNLPLATWLPRCSRTEPPTQPMHWFAWLWSSAGSPLHSVAIEILALQPPSKVCI